MPKFNAIQSNFTAGEVSPLMKGRVDINKYANGAAQVSNFVVKPQGGLWRRSGTNYDGTVKTSAKKTLIKEFIFSNLQEYVLEIGEYYIRVWYNGGFVETAPGSGIPLEVTTTYAESELFDLRFAQSADVMYITHSAHPPMKFQRLGANSFSFVQADILDGPYELPLADANMQMVGQTSVLDVTSGSPIFSTGWWTQAAITAMVGLSPSGYIKVTAAGHGLVVGDLCVVSGLKFLDTATGKKWHVPVPYGNGLQYVYAVAGNDVTIQGTSFVLPNTFYPGPITYDFSDAIIRKDGTRRQLSVYVETEWKLYTIERVKSTTVATLNELPVKDDLTDQVNLTYTATTTPPAPPGGTLVSNYDNVFSHEDLNKFVRDPQTGTWYKITGFTNGYTVSVTVANTVAYSWPYSTITYTKQVTGVLISLSHQFTAADYGRSIRLGFKSKWAWGKVLFTSGGAVILDIRESVPLTPQYWIVPNQFMVNNGVPDIVRLGSWCSALGFPQVVVFHEQRLMFMRNANKPQTVWMSYSADYENMEPSNLSDSVVTDAHAITYTLTSQRANPIIWAVSGSTLLIGTLGAEYQIKANALTSPITPTDIGIYPQTNHGSYPGTQAIKVGYAVLFTQRSARKLYELTYEFTLDSYVGKDTTVISEHILRQGGGVVAMTYQQAPAGIIWCALKDGTLASMTYDRSQDVAGWHRHSIGGGGLVESICSVLSEDGSEDVVYMVVKRTIGGVTKRFIEHVTQDFYPSTPQDKSLMQFLDCSQVYSGAPATNISGLGYLEGQTVQVVADGVKVADKVVAGGTITLDAPASVVVVGYSYRALLQVLPLEGGTANGTAQGNIKRINEITFRLLNSLGMKYGSDLNRLIDVEQRSISVDPMNQTPPFFTGDRRRSMPMEYNQTGQFYIIQDDPYPCNILAVFPDVHVYD